MSLEIRTPLNAIKGISDILKNDQANDENFKLLELMDYSANHLLVQVKQYPRFYKIKRWCFTLQNSEFNLNKLFNIQNERKSRY
jgi:signal transduction histidine kinase